MYKISSNLSPLRELLFLILISFSTIKPFMDSYLSSAFFILKDIDQYLAMEARKEAEVVHVRLENIKLKHKLKKKEQQLKSKVSSCITARLTLKQGAEPKGTSAVRSH